MGRVRQNVLPPAPLASSTSEPPYGHLGMARAEVSVYRMIYLDPTRPECQ